MDEDFEFLELPALKVNRKIDLISTITELRNKITQCQPLNLIPIEDPLNYKLHSDLNGALNILKKTSNVLIQLIKKPYLYCRPQEL